VSSGAPVDAALDDDDEDDAEGEFPPDSDAPGTSADGSVCASDRTSTDVEVDVKTFGDCLENRIGP
jgi:hypothetical protein